MAKGTPPNDEERLPWLEPYRDAIAQKQKVARRSHGGLVAVATGLAVLFAAGGGYWIGQRGDIRPASPETRMAEAPVTIAPVTPPPPPVEAPTPVAPTTQAPPPARSEPAPVAAPKRTAQAGKKPSSQAVRKRAIRNLAIERERLRKLRVARERAAAAARAPIIRQTYRPWPKMPSPGPAGQVVQLGAFRTEGRALAAYRTRLSRYPVLASMPRVVVPVITKPRGQVLYVLRLGTSSRQQSRIVCRNLRTSGDHCIVIG